MSAMPTRSLKMVVKSFVPDDDALPKEEYAAKWEKFKQLFAKVPEGKTKKLKMRIIKVFGPVPIAEIYKGKGSIKSYFILTAVLMHKGVEGLKISGIEHLESLDEKSKFNHLYYAATGESPEGMEVQVHPGIVGIRDVLGEVKREGARNDGKQAGFWFKVINYEQVVDGDGELIPQQVEDYDPIWVEPTAEEWDKYQHLADLSMAAKKRIYREPTGYQPQRPNAPQFAALVAGEEAKIRNAQAVAVDEEPDWDVPDDEADDDAEE
jgi:hypothetical protein